MKKTILSLSVIATLTACSSAGRVTLPIADALNSDVAKQKLNPEIKLSFDKTPVRENSKEWTTTRKTNNVGKSISKSCNRAFISALIALQNQANKVGATEVSNIYSFSQNVPFRSPTEYQCIEGHIMSSVTLKGTVQSKK